MKKQKKPKVNYRAIALIVIIIALIVFLIIKGNKKYTDVKLLPHYLYNTSTKEQAVGASDYTFVAKVNKLIRYEHNKIEVEKTVEYEPYSVYLITVLKNIKGTLIKDQDTEIKLLGGLHRSEKYQVLVNNLKYLEQDNYYILLPSADPQDGSLIINNPDEVYKLGKEYDESSEVINEYIKAYKKEEVPAAEYYSIPKERHYSIYDEVKKH